MRYLEPFFTALESRFRQRAELHVEHCFRGCHACCPGMDLLSYKAIIQRLQLPEAKVREDNYRKVDEEDFIKTLFDLMDDPPLRHSPSAEDE